jgi:hypothetical protein
MNRMNQSAHDVVKKKKKRSERSEELSKPEKKFGSANTQHTALLSNENKKERNESIFATS